MSKDETMTEEWERKSPHHIACQFQVTGGLEPCDCPEAEEGLSFTKERLQRLCADLDKQADHYASLGGDNIGGVAIRVALNGVATAIRDEFLSGKR